MKQNLRHQDTFNIYIYILTFTQHDLIFNLLLMIFICHPVWFVTNKRHNDEIIKRESQNYLFFHIFVFTYSQLKLNDESRLLYSFFDL